MRKISAIIKKALYSTDKRSVELRTMAAGFLLVFTLFILLSSLTPRLGFAAASMITAAVLLSIMLFCALIRKTQRR